MSSWRTTTVQIVHLMLDYGQICAGVDRLRQGPQYKLVLNVMGSVWIDVLDVIWIILVDLLNKVLLEERTSARDESKRQDSNRMGTLHT